MTVIAWDGKTLAADKRSTICGNPSTVTKIHRVPGGLVGFSGSGSHAMELLAWFKAGAPVESFPKPRDEDGAGSLFIASDGQIRLYSATSPYYEVLEQPFYARGGGRDYALAALYLGKTAREAVEVACALDTGCGNGIDTLTLASDQ